MTHQFTESPPLSQEFTEEFVSASSARFRGGDHEDLESLGFWGQLWLSLEVVDDAERTAKKLIVVLRRDHNDGYRVLVLKLLALMHSKRHLTTELAEYFTALYRQLWPGYTPPDRRGDRKEIDDRMELSGLSLV